MIFNTSLEKRAVGITVRGGKYTTHPPHQAENSMQSGQGAEFLTCASCSPFTIWEIISILYCAHLCMKCFLGVSNFLEEISSFSHSIVCFYFFALITREGFFLSLISPRGVEEINKVNCLPGVWRRLNEA